jgi:hypothetical protein
MMEKVYNKYQQIYKQIGVFLLHRFKLILCRII